MGIVHVVEEREGDGGSREIEFMDLDLQVPRQRLYPDCDLRLPSRNDRYLVRQVHHAFRWALVLESRQRG